MIPTVAATQLSEPGPPDAPKPLLVLGSSLAVMSGYRFVRRAAALGIPVVTINQGWTRGDAQADHKWELPLGPTLTRLAEQLVPA